LQVTVIATGFRGPNIKKTEAAKAQEEAKPRKPGFIDIGEWENVMNRSRRSDSPPRNSREDIFNTPAIFRDEEYLLQFEKGKGERTDLNSRAL
jgi:cell division protein FtsZ